MQKIAPPSPPVLNLFIPFSGLSTRLWLLAFVNFINRFGAMVMCFLTLYLTESLHYTLQQAGLILTFYGLGAIAGSQLGGWLTDRWGYQRVQLTSLLLAAVLLLVLMQVRDYYALCVTLFVYNLINESFRPANAIAVKLNSTPQNRTRAYSLLRTAFNLAITIALTVGGFLIHWGWHWLFIVDAATCVLAAATLFVYVPEIKAEKLKSNPSSDKQDVSPYKDKPFLFFSLLTFLNAFVFMQILWTVPPFFKQVYKWDEAIIGMVSALNGFIVMLVEIPLVFRIEGRKTLMFWIKLGIGCYGLSYLFFLLPFPYLAAVMYMVLISFGEIWVMPFSTTWIVRRAGEAHQGKYMGIYGISYSVANTLAPLLGTQLIARFGYHAFWGLLAAICLLVWLGFRYLEQQRLHPKLS